MLGNHGIGRMQAGMMIGSGKSLQKNPMQPKEKETNIRRANEKESGAQRW